MKQIGKYILTRVEDVGREGTIWKEWRRSETCSQLNHKYTHEYKQCPISKKL